MVVITLIEEFNSNVQLHFNTIYNTIQKRLKFSNKSVWYQENKA